jgi:RNA polymerase sigma factor (sigma-70 family)
LLGSCAYGEVETTTAAAPPLERSGVGEQPSDDDEAFAAVYETSYQRWVALARLTTGSTELAEEIVQDTFLDLYRNFAHVSLPGPWLRKAVMSRCTSWVRRRRLERRHDGSLETEPVTSDPDVIAFRNVLETLPARYRAVVLLRYVEDLSVSEIAVALGQREGTVKSLLSRARAQLKESFDGLG